MDADQLQASLPVDNTWGQVRLQKIAASGVTEVVVHVIVGDEPFDFRSLKGQVGDARAQRIAQRESSLGPNQEYAEGIVAALGGEALGRTWLVPGITARIPIDAVADLSATDGIVGVNPDVEYKIHNWEGELITTGMLTQQLETAGYMGETGGRVTSPTDNIKLGFAEPAESPSFNCGHVGWLDSAGGSSRIIDTDLCTASSCAGSTCSTNGQHTTTVAWVAAGSIEQAQDATYPGTNTLDQRRRSGIAREAEIYVYQWVHAQSCGFTMALQTAVSDGVDVLNASFGSEDCDLTVNPCSANTAIVNATNAGTMVVASSGNDAPSSGDGWCSVNWPAVRSEVLSVSALQSTNHNLPYHELPFYTSASYGYDTVSVWPFTSGGTPMVDVVAPAFIDHYFSGAITSGANAYFTTASPPGSWGTSYSAPAAAAIAGLTREWHSDFGWSNQNDARSILANTMVMGDNYSGQSDVAHKQLTVPADRAGFGRLRARWPNATSLGTWNSWGDFTRTLSTNDVSYITVPGNPQHANKIGVKVAAMYTDADMSAIANIRVQLVDTCPGGGGEQVLRTASDYVLRKLIRWNGSMGGRCLAIKLTGLAVSGSQKIHVAVYTYSNGTVH